LDSNDYLHWLLLQQQQLLAVVVVEHFDVVDYFRYYFLQNFLVHLNR